MHNGSGSSATDAIDGEHQTYERIQQTNAATTATATTETATTRARTNPHENHVKA